MLIENYSFGKIMIEGKQYTSDLMICGDKIKEDWWRKDGHSLCKADLTWILKQNPDVLIVGTGKNGVMKVPQSLKDKLEQQGIKVIAKTTDQAVDTFNKRYSDDDRLIAAGFHLTC